MMAVWPPNYGVWAYPLVLVGASVFSLMMMMVLVSKKEHERILGNLMPAHAINKLRKGRTVVERYDMVTSEIAVIRDLYYHGC